MASTLPLSNPLFSIILTLYILILLYVPHFLLTSIISFSPLFISTLILLLFLLRLGASQGLKFHNDPDRAETRSPSQPEPEPEPISLVESGEEQRAKTEEPCKWVETREATNHRPEPEWCDQGWADFDPSRSGEEEKEAELHCNRVETRSVIEPEPVKLEYSAKAEHYCNRVETRTFSELGPDTEAKTEPLCNWVETQNTTESRPEVRPEPDWVDPGWAEFDSRKRVEEAGPHSNRVKTRLSTDPKPSKICSEPEPEPKPARLDQGMVKQGAKAIQQCNWAETRPSTEPGQEPEPNRCYQGWEFDKQADPHCKRVEARPASDPGHGPELKLEFEIEPKPELEKSAVPNQDERSTRLEPGTNVFRREWDVGAPLEVIYEAYEGEEDGDDEENDAFNVDNQLKKIKRYPSLSRYYPESESDSGSDPDSSESSVWDGEFPAMEQWDDDDDDDEEEREGLIEIALSFNHLHQHGHTTSNKEINKLVDDEDNLIEIDISPTRSNYEFSW